MGFTVAGISAFYHDSACCVLRDGELICAAEEERFSRIKHDSGLPWRALRFCLEQAAISIRDLDCLAFYEDPQKKLERQIWMGIQPGGQAVLGRALDRLRRGESVEHRFRELLGFEGEVEFVDHHHSHAASAYYFSGYDDSAVLTVDGVGEWATTAYGSARGPNIQFFDEVAFPHSLGLLYSTITAYLGFEVNEGEYKVMGLAPYGKPSCVDEMRTLIEAGSGGQFRLQLEYFDFFKGKRMFSDRLPALFGPPARRPEEELTSVHCDIARSLQVVLEETLLQQVHYLHTSVPSENLCMAGGVALNCVANSRILRDGPFQRIFVQPAAGDSGGALGAAAVAHVRRTREHPGLRRLRHVYLGPSYSSGQIARLLVGTPANPLDCRGDLEALVEATVEKLLAGKVVGWFQGRMEFGPRSLGGRSIIGDPRSEKM